MVQQNCRQTYVIFGNTYFNRFSVFVQFRGLLKTNTIFSLPAITKGMLRNRIEQIYGQLCFNDNGLAPAHGTPGMIGFIKLGLLLMLFVRKVKRYITLGK